MSSPSAEPITSYLRRVGAASVEDATRWLLELCEALTRAGVPLDVDPSLIQVGPAGVKLVLEPRAFTGTPREQVRRVAALGFELIKGMPPPDGLVAADAWVGLRPELARVLSAALAGTGAPDVTTFGNQLAALRSDTAAYAALERHDTITSTKPPPRPSEGALAGTTLGSYELIALLGSGGMGEVYRARHAKLGREVAVKVLRPEYASMPEVVQRFFQEAKVVNDINHPHIVQIVDFAEVPEGVFCVMELLRGRSLSRVVSEEGPLPLARIRTLMEQACDALVAAHARGVVHRDIKPDNLFVTVDGDGREQIKVLDFGIARRLTAEDSAKTRAGMVMGTPSYMAPEQAAGRPVDARADVYAVGVVLYELLTATSMIDLKAPPTRVERSALGEPLSPQLARLLESCLSFDPDRRPSSVQPLREALQSSAGSPTRSGRRVGVAAGVSVAVLAGAWVALRPGTPAIERVEIDAGIQVVVPVAPPPVVVVDASVPEPVDAGPVVVDAGTSAVVKKSRGAALEKRVASVRKRYAELVKRFGKTQLTSIERQTIEAALEAPDSTLLQDAEAALAQAERRLVR
ncbi:MAG: serine/threonine-protein kinase [Archangium sp.]